MPVTKTEDANQVRYCCDANSFDLTVKKDNGNLEIIQITPMAGTRWADWSDLASELDERFGIV